MDQERYHSSNPGQTSSTEADDDRVTIVDQYDDEQPDSEENRLAYMRSVVPPTESTRKWPLIIIACLVVLAILAGGGYYTLKQHHMQAAKSVTRGNKTEATKTGGTSTAPKASQSVSGTNNQYVSNGNDLNFTLTMPTGWTAVPASDDNTTDQPITITSPATTIIDASGTSTSGKVVISIRPVSSSISELASGTATAALASTQFAYTNPTSSQYKYPYLTYIDLTAGANPSQQFQEVLISGTTQFAQNQAITASSLSVDPIISASFYRCFTTECTGTGQIPLGITSNTWQSNELFVQTLSAFESMQFH